jgi:hypothetical protein
MRQSNALRVVAPMRGIRVDGAQGSLLSVRWISSLCSAASAPERARHLLTQAMTSWKLTARQRGAA